MNLLEAIINDLVNTKTSLNEPLLKTKVLATRIDNQPLLTWVNGELAGYPEDGDLPGYRKDFGQIYGNYINGNIKVTNQALPISQLPDYAQADLKKFDFYESVETLASILENDKGGYLSSHFNAELRSFIEESIRKMGNPYFQLLSAYKRTAGNKLTQILSVVRSQLLDFMLQLEKEFGTEVDIQTLRDHNNQIITIMNSTIATSGDNNNINTGSAGGDIWQTNSSTKTISAESESKLKSYGVEQGQIEELKAMLSATKDKPTLTSKVLTWVGGVAASVAAKGLAANIPAITEFIQHHVL